MTTSGEERQDAGAAGTGKVLTVVLVTYNSARTIGQCLDSIATNLLGDVPSDVVVVDNASTDGTIALVAERFPWVDVRPNVENRGFGAANNQVLPEVVTPYTLVLNPDTCVHEGAVQHLLARLDAEPQIGVVGCRLVRQDGTFDRASKRHVPGPLDAVLYLAPGPLGARSRYLAPEVHEHGTGRVGSVNGAFMLLRTSAMHEVGYFDERFWMYAEDLDWCKRFSDAGWHVVYDGRVTVTHLKGASSEGTRDLALHWQFYKSMDQFYVKHSNGTLRLLPVRAGIRGAFAASAVRARTRQVGRR